MKLRLPVLQKRVLDLRVLLLLACAYALASATYTAFHQSVTYDEPNHISWSERLVEGRSIERNVPGDKSTTPVTAGNVLFDRGIRRLVSHGALPAFLADFSTWHFYRAPMLAWLCILIGATFLLGRELGGRQGGLMAALLVALDPNFIAHSTVITVDVPFAALGTLLMTLLVKGVKAPSIPLGVAIGVTLGLLCSTKFTVLLFAVSFVLAYFWLPLGRDAVRRSSLFVPMMCVAGVWTLVVIALMYAERGMGIPLAEISFKHELFEGLQAQAPGLRLPLPKEFLTGVDACLAEERTREWNVVILDQYFRQGIWYYFPLLWLLKTPLGLLALYLFGLWRLSRETRWFKEPDVLFVAANAVLFLGYFCFVFKAQVGYRYILFCLPLLAALSARGWAMMRMSNVAKAAIGFAAAVSLAEMVPFYDNPLSFTNLFVLPKKQAYLYVADSNLDWAQSGGVVDEWKRSHSLEDAPSTPPHIVQGWNLIPVNFLAGVWWNRRQFEWVRKNLVPEELIGSSVAAFNVSKSEFEEFLRVERTFESHRMAKDICSNATGWRLLRAPSLLEQRAGEVTSVCIRTVRATIRIVNVVGSFDAGRVDEFGLPRHEYLERHNSLWFRLEPGVHAFQITSREGAFSGRVELVDGEAEMAFLK